MHIPPSDSVLTRLNAAARAFAAALLLLAAGAACEDEAARVLSPGAVAAPTVTPIPPSRAPALDPPSAALAEAVPAATPTPAGEASVTPKPSLSPTAPPSPFQLPAGIAPPPSSDLVALARRFRPGQDARLAHTQPRTADDIGRQETFSVIDLVRLRVQEVRATLQLVTPHALWYTAAGSNVLGEQLKSLAAVYEERVFPAVAEATLGYVPGESDGGFAVPVTMLIAPISGAAGYFASADYYTPAVFPYTNQRPMLYLDARVARAGAGAMASLTGHELQHLLHYLVDPTEHTWVNEGISEVTERLVAPKRAIAPPGFLEEVSLTNWPSYDQPVGKHYNAAHLFFAYFTQRYGMEALAPLVAQPDDGALGIEAFLREAGHPESFPEVFMDWATANLLDGRAAMPYGYADASLLSPMPPRRSLSPDGALNDTVAPFATDYIRLDLPPQGATLLFEGDAAASILDAPPFSGQGCWWSNRGDSSHSRLVQEFDLSHVSEATLTFRMWHNLEEMWDYLYVTASADGGSTWHVLPGAHTRTDDPIGATYGPGITGRSDGWVQERIDLTPFAGGTVLVSFEQVLDAAISLDGACIDDIAIAAISFFDDAETDGAWTADGFVRTNNVLAQRFGVRLIIEGGGDGVTVEDVALDDVNSGRLHIPSLDPGQTATVIVASLTPHTRQPAAYSLRLVQQ